ncbi:DUF3095 domain-containing protein [Aequorivita sp. H23M31]|uniref:DUF3095 domain-containing protein n=1 Tax=Aequorivita ciconiae TaxID=2494375 RepID=A0A410G096_9FLAO|nr:DUF3095 domain-containing protein [Aequorivita sp. H23M31]QAA80689.1 DUF3095 domain-containing protein [Aequorivita sp. H23M31]
MQNDLDFYKNIAKNNLSLSELLTREALFSVVPKTWSIVIADIENSTQAVQKGAHNDVNLSATGSIVTVLNTLKNLDHKIEVPYFFGGDGATFLIPNSTLGTVLKALQNYSRHIENTFQLMLRFGYLGVQDVYLKGITLKITKIRYNKLFTAPVVLGKGLKYAEREIKESFKNSSDEKNTVEVPNLEGMECRWDEIYPKTTDKKVICLLVDCKNEKDQPEVYSIIMKEIDSIFGNLEIRNPISTLRLKLNTSLSNIQKEMNLKLGRSRPIYLLRNWFVTFFGRFYFKYFRNGRLYKYRITQLSDTIMMDGFLNTVLSGTEKEVKQLKVLLDDLESKNKIVYGLHITHASIMSCYIEDRAEKHIHFVDGTEGGYTSAAIILKEKIRRLHSIE